jgi:hypothetical protein
VSTRSGIDRVCNDIRLRLHRASKTLEDSAQGQGAFADPRGLYLDVVMTIHELEAVLRLMQRSVLP